MVWAFWGIFLGVLRLEGLQGLRLGFFHGLGFERGSVEAFGAVGWRSFDPVNPFL